MFNLLGATASPFASLAIPITAHGARLQVDYEVCAMSKFRPERSSAFCKPRLARMRPFGTDRAPSVLFLRILCRLVRIVTAQDAAMRVAWLSAFARLT